MATCSDSVHGVIQVDETQSPLHIREIKGRPMRPGERMGRLRMEPVHQPPGLIRITF